MPDLTETLAWLVDIPSVTGDEERIRDEIANRLSDLPLEAIRRSLVVGDPGPGKVVLAGHLDTVPPQGNAGSRLDGDRLHGLGATDMKGGLAVMIHLLEELGTDRVIGVFYAGEEGPLSGNDLGLLLDEISDLAAAEAAVVMEPTDRQLHLGCQGGLNATVWFEGEPAHSARPWLGINAITRAGKFLTAMNGRPPEPHVIEGLEYKEVISVTRASGGVANNIIPARFELNVNYRFAPDREPEEAVEHLRTVCSAADGLEVADLAPGAYPAVGHALFQRLADAAGADRAAKQGWTDVAQFAQRGVSAVNFGPGETALAHKPGESVRLDDLEWAHRALREVLADEEPVDRSSSSYTR